MNFILSCLQRLRIAEGVMLDPLFVGSAEDKNKCSVALRRPEYADD
jgi:hypothetical protein